MKRYFLIFLLIASFAYAEEPCWECNETLAWGLINQMEQTVAAGGGTCEWGSDSAIDDAPYTDGGDGGNNVSDVQFFAQKLTVDAQSDITGYIMKLEDGASVGTFVVELYNHDASDYPDGSSVVSNSTYSVDVNSLPATNDDHDCELTSVLENLPAGTYWLVAKVTGLTGTGVSWEKDFTSTGNRLCRNTNDITDWSADTSCWDDRSNLMELRGCED